MKISDAIKIAKEMPEIRKEKVRNDVAEMIRRNKANCPTTEISISAPTAYILERCFDKRKGDIKPEQILEIINN